MRGKGIGGHHSSRADTTDWLTPPEMLAALGEFDLDPCCPDGMPWKTAARMLTRKDDGLASPWKGRVWLNPPYGREIEAWMQRMAEHGDGIALIFARTEVAFWFEHVWPRAAAILFIRGRLHFHYPSGERAKANAGGPSALVAYGSKNAEALARSKIAGQFVPLNTIKWPHRVKSVPPFTLLTPRAGA